MISALIILVLVVGLFASIRILRVATKEEDEGEIFKVCCCFSYKWGMFWGIVAFTVCSSLLWLSLMTFIVYLIV